MNVSFLRRALNFEFNFSALSQSTFYFKCAAVPVHNRFYDGHAQTAAGDFLGAGKIRAVKWFKDVLYCLLVHTDPVVLNEQRSLPA